MMDIQTRNILNKSEVFGLSGSGDGDTVKNKPSMYVIMHGTNNPVAVCDVFYFTGNM